MNQIFTQHQIVDKKENKTTTAKKEKDRREGKGRVLAISRNVYRLLNSDIYYVESESSDDHYYFVKYNHSVFESLYCSCKDNSTRHLKCKHLFAIEFAIKWGTLRDIDKLLTTADTDQSTLHDIQATAAVTTKPEVVTARRTKSYLEDDYDF